MGSRFYFLASCSFRNWVSQSPNKSLPYLRVCGLKGKEVRPPSLNLAKPCFSPGEEDTIFGGRGFPAPLLTFNKWFKKLLSWGSTLNSYLALVADSLEEKPPCWPLVHLSLFFPYFETELHTSQAGFALPVWPRMTLNFAPPAGALRLQECTATPSLCHAGL